MNEGGKITVNITTGAIIKAALIVILCFALYYLRDLVLVILTAVVIASVLEPATRTLIRYKIPRVFAAIVVYVLLLVVLALIFYFLVPTLISQATQVITSAPQYFSTVDLFSHFKQGSFLNIKSLFPNLPATVSTKDILHTFTGFFAGYSGGFLNTLATFFGGVISFVLIIILSFYLCVQEEGVGDFLKIITPVSKQNYVLGLWKRSQMKIGRWMQGQLLLGCIVAFLIFLGLSVLDVRHALLLSVLAGIFELIPVVGMSIAGIPAFILGFADGGITLALLVAGLYLIVQQFEANLIYPMVVKKVVGVPPLLVIIALAAGAKLGGFLGALLSVPISVSLVEYLDDLQKRKNAPDEAIPVVKVKLEE